MSHDVSELFSRQKIFHAHKQMQYELSSNARVQADYDQKELGDIRAQFRTIDPLYRAIVDEDAWPADDEIGMGRSAALSHLVRARVALEVPAMEAAGVLAQPALLVPCVFPGARVVVQQHDAFSCELEVVLPSILGARFEQRYRVRQTLYHGPEDDPCILVLWQDTDPAAAPRFGQHLLRLVQTEDEECAVTYLVAHAQSAHLTTTLLPRLQSFAVYAALGRFSAALRAAATAFYMCDESCMHLKRAWQRKETVLRWAQEVCGQ